VVLCERGAPEAFHGACGADSFCAGITLPAKTPISEERFSGDLDAGSPSKARQERRADGSDV